MLQYCNVFYLFILLFKIDGTHFAAAAHPWSFPIFSSSHSQIEWKLQFNRICNKLIFNYQKSGSATNHGSNRPKLICGQPFEKIQYFLTTYITSTLSLSTISCSQNKTLCPTDTVIELFLINKWESLQHTLVKRVKIWVIYSNFGQEIPFHFFI